MLEKLSLNQTNNLKASFKTLIVDNKKSTPVAMVINNVKDNENGKKNLLLKSGNICFKHSTLTFSKSITLKKFNYQK